MSDPHPQSFTPSTGPGLLRRLAGLPPHRAAHEPLPARGIHSILICHLNQSLGNALLLSPLLIELERRYPGARISIVTRSPVARELYEGFPQVEDIQQLPSQWLGELPRYLRSLRHLRRTHYDLVIDPDAQSSTSRSMIQLFRARFALGYDGSKKAGHLTHAVPVPAAPESKGQLGVYLLRAGMGLSMEDAGPPPALRLSPEEIRLGRQVLATLLAGIPSHRTEAPVLALFANATGPKQKDGHWWLRLLQVLEPVLAGWTIIELIPADGVSMVGDRYPAFYSHDIRKLAAVIQASTAYLSLDCGVMHLASTTAAPTIGVFTTTSAAQWGPYGPGNWVVAGYHQEPEAIAQSVITTLQQAGLLD
ncbi:glycosyltransferase family 9 protein [Frateuria aurantia]